MARDFDLDEYMARVNLAKETPEAERTNDQASLLNSFENGPTFAKIITCSEMENN